MSTIILDFTVVKNVKKVVNTSAKWYKKGLPNKIYIQKLKRVNEKYLKK